MPPPSINETFLYPGHKEVLSPVIFGKIGGPHWVFSAWSIEGQLKWLSLGQTTAV